MRLHGSGSMAKKAAQTGKEGSERAAAKKEFGKTGEKGERKLQLNLGQRKDGAIIIIGTSTDKTAVRNAVRELMKGDESDAQSSAHMDINTLLNWINKRTGLSGVRKPASSDTANIIGEEILDTKTTTMPAHRLCDIFTGCSDDAIVKRAAEKLADNFDVPDVLNELEYALRQIENPSPTYFIVACPNARRILGEVILERPSLVEKLKQDARGVWSNDKSKQLAVRLLDAVAQACRDVELLLDIRETLLLSGNMAVSAGAVLVNMFEEGTLAGTKDTRVLTALLMYTDKPDIIEYVFENCLFGEGKQGIVDLIARRGLISFAIINVAGKMLQRLDRTHAPIVYIVARHHENKQLRKTAVDKLASFGPKFHQYMAGLFGMICIGKGAYPDTQKYAVDTLERLGNLRLLKKISAADNAFEMPAYIRRAIRRCTKKKQE